MEVTRAAALVVLLTGALASTTAEKSVPLYETIEGGAEPNLKICKTQESLSCTKVKIDVDSLLLAEDVTLPMDRSVLAKSSTTGKRDANGRRSMYFASETNSATAVISFVVDKEDKEVIGSINTADGASYEIEGDTLVKINMTMIQDGEKDTVEPPKSGKMSKEETRQLSEEYKLLLKGLEDQETLVNVSVMVYHTKEFANYEPNVNGYVKNMFTVANAAMENSDIPLRLKHHCTQEAEIAEGNSVTMLYQLAQYKGSPSASLQTADIAFLLARRFTNNVCGTAFVNTARFPFGVAMHLCAVNYYTFAHEIAHIFGAYHNREVSRQNPNFCFGHGYLVLPKNPISTKGERTIMAYPASGHRNRVNYFSSPSIQYAGERPTGDFDNDNARVLTITRFRQAAVGDESRNPSAGDVEKDILFVGPKRLGRWAEYGPEFFDLRNQSATCSLPSKFPGGIYINRGCPGAFVGGKALVCGTDSLNKLCYFYDDVTDTWTPGPELRQHRIRTADVLLNNDEWWITGGWSRVVNSTGHLVFQRPTNTTEIYKACSNKFEAGPELPYEMYDHCIAKLSEDEYMVFPGSRRVPIPERRVPLGPQTYSFRTKQWRETSKMQEGGNGWYRVRMCGTITRRNGTKEVVAVTNARASGLGWTFRRLVLIYNPESDDWRRGPDSPMRMWGFASVPYGNTFLVAEMNRFGPWPRNEMRVDIYDEDNDAWIVKKYKSAIVKSWQDHAFLVPNTFKRCQNN